MASCAASVLFGAITSVGRWSRSTSQAVVADFPVPVAPSSTTSFSPAWIRRARSSIAVGWSPLGRYSLTTSNGATVRWRSVTGRMGPPYVAPPTRPAPRGARAPAGYFPPANDTVAAGSSATASEPNASR